MKRKRNHWTRWCGIFLAETVVLLGCCAAFTAWVDPYQIYHPVSTGRPILDIRLQRFYVPGLAKTSQYEVALLGTSMLQNIPNSAVRRLCGGPAVNLCISGASIHEEAEVLRLALRHEGTKTIIATLDFNSLSGGAGGQVIGIHDPFPPYLYTNSLFDKGPYLLSLDSILTSIHVLNGVPDEGETMRTNWPWKFPDSVRFGARNAVSGIDPRNINKKFGMTNLDLATMEKAFAENIFPLLDRNNGIRIHFVLPPYSILVWHDFAQRGQIPVYFDFKKWLISQSQKYRFDVIDFQDRADIITNLTLYADIYHSSEPVDEEMVDAACHGGAVLNEQNFEARTQSLLRLVETTDPVAIVEAAKAGNSVSGGGSVRLP